MFRPLRDEDEVRLLEMLAAGWDVVGEGNDTIELWDREYDVCDLISDLIGEIDSKIDEGVDWSFLVSMNGIKMDRQITASDITDLEELLPNIDGVALQKHEWTRSDQSGTYMHLLVKKVERYRVMETLRTLAWELQKQL